MTTTTTPYMGLIIPDAGLTGEAGPAYATEINAAMVAIDSHSHATGHGTYITPAGISINASLPLNGYGITTAKSVQYTAQGAALSDLLSLYTVGNDLYFTDGQNNKIPITTGGVVNVSGTGSISGMSGTVTVSYTALIKTFKFLQSATTTADLYAGSISITEKAASANAITIASPTGVASAYGLVLPGVVPTANQLIRQNAAATALENVTVSGDATVSVTHAAGTMTIAANAAAYGTYTPTLTSTGGSLFNPSPFTFSRVGSIVTVSGYFSYAGGATVSYLYITLPIIPANNFPDYTQGFLVGGSSSTSSYQSLYGQSASGTKTMRTTTLSFSGTIVCSVMFQYILN